tara:strand:+ start:1955 stop:2371 length:417 start_codon:yes stop_codon:yes gene_type:complete
MFGLFKKNKIIVNNNDLIAMTAALLIHAAKIDQNYENNEKNIIKKTLIQIGAEEKDVDKIINKAEKYENESNQILELTKEIKKTDKNFKIKVIEALWNIIYSDGKADIYENSLMRRLAGLMYVDDKLVGQIKEKIKSR